MIRAYVGLFGQGKTLSMVNDAIPHVLAGRQVFTNTPFQARFWERPSLVDFIKGKRARQMMRLPIFLESHQFELALKNERNALFLVDEASIWFSSYQWNNLSPDYIIRFAQARKFGLDIYYTSQLFKHTVKRLRDLTNEVVECSHRSYPLIGSMLSNITFSPEKFDYSFFNKEMENRFIIRRKFVKGKALKELYACYDTMYSINYSSVMSASKDMNTQAPIQTEFPAI